MHMHLHMLSPLLYFSPKNTSSSRHAALGPSKESVYVAAVPLRAMPGPAQRLLSAAYYWGLGHPHLQHYIVLIKSQSPRAEEQVP
jgi:hypothetical protein